MSNLSTDNEFTCTTNVISSKEFELQYVESEELCMSILNEKEFTLYLKGFTESP